MTDPSGVPVRLTAAEVRECSRWARLRKGASRNAGRDASWSVVRTSVQEWEQECGGMYAELAVANLYGLTGAGSVNSWQRSGDLRGGGVQVEVRHTRSHNNNLLLRHDDRERVKLDAIYVLVTGWPLTMWVRGWLTGAEGLDAAVPGNPHGHRPLLFVSPDRLHDPESLRSRLTNRGGGAEVEELLTRREWREKVLRSQGVGLGQATAAVEDEVWHARGRDWDDERWTEREWEGIVEVEHRDRRPAYDGMAGPAR